MPAYRRRTWWDVAATAALVAAACSEATAPKLNDPAQLNADLQAVSVVFQSAIFRSFSTLLAQPGVPASAALMRAGALVRATTPAALQRARQPYVESAARAEALRQFALAMSPAGTMLSVIPDMLKGKTFVWNTDLARYSIDQTRTDADPNGVRFELYRIDPATKLPADNPPTAIAELDLIDRSTTDTYELEVVVSPTPEFGALSRFVDYTITATTQGNPVTLFQAAAVGFVSDGFHRLDFNATFTVTNPSSETPNIAVNVTWTFNNPALSIAVHESVTWQDPSHLTLSINSSVAHGQTVALGGIVRMAFGATDTTLTANLAMTVDGAVFARITGTTPNIQFSPSTLNEEELLALVNMFALAVEVEDTMQSLFDPLEHFVI